MNLEQAKQNDLWDVITVAWEEPTEDEPERGLCITLQATHIMVMPESVVKTQWHKPGINIAKDLFGVIERGSQDLEEITALKIQEFLDNNKPE